MIQWPKRVHCSGYSVIQLHLIQNLNKPFIFKLSFKIKLSFKLPLKKYISSDLHRTRLFYSKKNTYRPIFIGWVFFNCVLLVTTRKSEFLPPQTNRLSWIGSLTISLLPNPCVGQKHELTKSHFKKKLLKLAQSPKPT